MKTLILTASAVAILFSLDVAAQAGVADDGISAIHQIGDSVDRRKPRVRGGSGCDDPRDLIEHPECR
jgi:hypothetical protein